MSTVTSLGAPAFMTTYLLFLVGCVAQKVYFDCGAKVDVVDVQGLILSPGFPYNYSSGTHCVWQFFVPIDYQLILEIFDFDVFESHDAVNQYSNMANFYDEDTEEEMIQSPGSSVADESSKEETHQSEADVAKNQKSFQDGDEKQVIVQEQSTKMEIAKVSNSAKRSADVKLNSAPQPSLVVIPDSLPPNNNKPYNSPSTTVKTTTVSSTFVTETVTPETPQSVLDACPHDVLYISDLITFSSRFCGSNRPPSSQLVFGSHQEMVEVIMELITTTHWGRGFALLFHYHNLTEPGGVRRDVAFAASKVDSLLAAVSGAAFLAMILTSALCIIFRPKLCPKRANCSTSSGPEMVEGAPNAVSEVSELQLIAENQINLEITRKQENKSDAAPHTVSAGGDTSLSAEVDLSSGLTELDLGADEVFISPSPAPSAVTSRLQLSPHTQRDRFLRLSETGPSPSGDWPSPDPSAPRSKSGNGSRPRAWSVRTFHDFLPPLPQLHKRWCSWNSNSPFTKLVDTGTSSLVADGRGNNGREVFSEVNLAKADQSTTSDSSISTASYPLSQPAQRQRRLNSISNLRRSRFTGPCFGFGTTDTTKTPAVQGPCAEPGSASPTDRDVSHAGKRRSEVQGEAEHVSVPVFAISEEEDRQPLVPAEHLEQPAALPMLNGLARGVHDGKRSAAGGSPKSQRARGEWRPWGSQASGGVLPALKTSHSGCEVQVPIGPATALCSVANQM